MPFQLNRGLLVLLVLSVALSTAVGSPPTVDGPTSGSLSYDQRLKAFEAVEDVYWSHRLWPQDNPTAKPEREEVLSPSQVAAKMERSYLMEAVLERMWGEHLTQRQIQGELDRIFRSTRHPMLLQDIVVALDKDPILVAECFARPRLAERLVRERFARDPEIHRGAHALAETELSGIKRIGDLADSSAVVSETIWIRDDGMLGSASERGEVRLGPTEWQRLFSNLAERFATPTAEPQATAVSDEPADLIATWAGRGVSHLVETDDAFVVVEVVSADEGSIRTITASWPKVAFSVWVEDFARGIVAVAPSTGSYALPKQMSSLPCIDDTWTPTQLGAPIERVDASAVWTGSEMIVWGGMRVANRYLSSGGRYDPVTDSWLATSTDGAPSGRISHTAVWTGSEMVIWGGFDGSQRVDTGGRYDPATDSWQATTTTDAPEARRYHAMVWAGGEVIVWGGDTYSGDLNTGGRYDPGTDSWQATSTTDAPVAREYHTAIWTGSEMVVWGGYGGGEQNTGGRYDPGTDSWSATTTSGAPLGRYGHRAVWTGSQMVVWGGGTLMGYTATGGRYDPVTDSWQATSTTDVPNGRRYHTAVWTGNVMIVWGGYDSSGQNTGGRYDPATDTWLTTTTTGAPAGRSNHPAVWTGSEMIVWGGRDTGGQYLNSGGRYDPVSDGWTATSASGAPLERTLATSVWTGSEMIVWGGNNFGENLMYGSRYEPATDSWLPTTTTGAPAGRQYHTAVWTGNEMIVWGGHSGSSDLDTGGRYDPASDSWLATTTADAPSARSYHETVWSGAEMIVWGGYGGGWQNTGGRYDPVTDTWLSTTTTGAPDARRYFSAVWAGSEMIVWGGQGSSVLNMNTGGRYDPATDSWLPTTTTDAPGGRNFHESVWTGSLMIVWGGHNGQYLNTGGRYDPGTDGWLATTTAGAPDGRTYHAMAWTGDEMVAWGGYGNGFLDSGGRYDPSANSWTSTSAGGAPDGRRYHVGVWTGTELMVWGGEDSQQDLRTGGRYCASGVLGIDFGDAPDPTYPTLVASDGALHPFDAVLYLGALVDGETDGQPTIGADGDDLDGIDDEDGVALGGPLQAGFDTDFQLTSSASGLLNAWIDFNADGDWADAGEQIFTDTALAAGTTDLPVSIPLDSEAGDTFARFRLDSGGGLSPTGLAADGEVEDYLFSIAPSAEVAVSIADSPDPVADGSRLTYYVHVTNSGGLDATQVTLVDTLPVEVSFVSANPGAPDCIEAAGVVTCDLGTVLSGTLQVVTIEVDTPDPFSGSISNAASVSMAENDPIPANNSDTESTTVVFSADYIFADGFESGSTSAWD